MPDGASLMTALFADHESAERAYASLVSRGYSAADVRLLMTGETRDGLLAAAVRRRDRPAPIHALVTALVAGRIPTERAALYEEALRSGGIVLAIAPRSALDAEHLEREWTKAGGTLLVSPKYRTPTAA